MKEQEEKEFKELFSGLEPEQPSMRFTKNVMDAVEGARVAPAAKRYVNPWVVKGIAAVFIVSVLVLGIYAYNNAANLPVYNYISSAKYIVTANFILLLVLVERWLSSKRRIRRLERMN
jgi:quinol-cytochrome oxidoreductase complex cytochrome b subunit